MTGFILEGLTNKTLAEKLIAVGEGHGMLNELRKQLNYPTAEPLTVTIDSSEIHKTINKAMKDLGVLGEVGRTDVPDNMRGPQFFRRTLDDALDCFHTKPRFRVLLLLLAAQCVDAIESLDEGNANE